MSQTHVTDDKPSVAVLIADLSSQDVHVRARSREQLVQRGSEGIMPLTQALESPVTSVRWEAAKALSMIGDPAATDALIRALDDRDRPIRWLAAKGLIAIGPQCVPALLHTLVAHGDNACIREGAHHVLSELCDDRTHPVVVALKGSLPSLEAPLAAYHALDKLRNNQ